jgi:hypothetical protein
MNGPITKIFQFALKELGIRVNVRAALIIAFLMTLISLCVLAATRNGMVDRFWGQTFSSALFVYSLIIFYIAFSYIDFVNKENKDAEIAVVKELVFKNPDKPQFAWDLARVKLEGYLDRNLYQVRSIYWLTLIVMIFGFGFIIYGLYNAFNNFASLPVAIVASASGVIISFIGGSLLIIYKSVLTQSKDYVSVLERINAVGMAVQVIESIPDNASDIKNESMAELARQLLTLYAIKHAGKNT